MMKILKRKKEESHLMAILVKRDLLLVSWEIDLSKWKKKIELAEAAKEKEYLFIDILSIESGKYNKLESIPVFGLENKWHIFIKKEYYGKKLTLNLSYRDKKGKLYDILVSDEIYIPLSIENIESKPGDKSILMELSGIRSMEMPGKENTSR